MGIWDELFIGKVWEKITDKISDWTDNWPQFAVGVIYLLIFATIITAIVFIFKYDVGGYALGVWAILELINFLGIIFGRP